MAKVQVLRALVEQRLSAAVEEIFVLFGRTVAEYEEELCRSEQERQRQKKLLDAVFNPRVSLQRAECVRAQEALTEKQEWSSSQVQKDSEPPHVKAEPENAWTTHGGEQLQGPEEFKCIPFPVKTEHNGNEGKPPSSQLQQGQSEETGGAEPLASSSPKHMETDTDGEPEPDGNTSSDRHLQPDTADKTSDSSDTEDSEDDEREKNEPQSGLNSEYNGCYTARKPFRCSVCDKTFRLKAQITVHMRTHTGEKPYSCSICGKSFTQRGTVTRHLVTHRHETSLKCYFCGTRFSWLHQVRDHRCGKSSELRARCEAGREQMSCSVCGVRIASKTHLRLHMMADHSGKKLLSCSICDEPFRFKSELRRHMTTHSGEKPHKCLVCDQRFTRNDSLILHMRKHAGDNMMEIQFWDTHGCNDPV